MESRYDQIKRLADMFAQTRYDSKKSQEYMAAELCVSKKTIQNWEKGISQPDIFQTMQWFQICGLNPIHYLISFVYNKETSPQSEESEIRETFDVTCDNLSDKGRRALLYLLYGKHGSDAYCVLQLLLAYLHMPLKYRSTIAGMIYQFYTIAETHEELICEENIRPDIELLEKAIAKGVESALSKKFGYSLDIE